MRASGHGLGRVNTIAKTVDYQHEAEKAEKHRVEFFEPGEYASEALQTTEQAAASRGGLGNAMPYWLQLNEPFPARNA